MPLNTNTPVKTNLITKNIFDINHFIEAVNILNPHLKGNELFFYVKRYFEFVISIRTADQFAQYLYDFTTGHNFTFHQENQTSILGLTILSDEVNKNSTFCLENTQVTNINHQQLHFKSLHYVNGLPIIAVFSLPDNEQHSALSEFTFKEQCYQELKQAREHFPNILTCIPLVVFINNKYFTYASNFASSPRYFYSWNKNKNPIENLDEFTALQNIIAMLKHYYFVIHQPKTNFLLLQYHQIQAVNAALERLTPNNSITGMFEHTQGAGKTLTMIAIAKQLLTTSHLKSHSSWLVCLVIDRNQLENQLLDNFTRLKIRVNNIDKQSTLVESFQNKYTPTGLAVMTIQKFTDTKNSLPLSTSQQILFLIDEVHRSQTGVLHSRLRQQFPNASYFGFSGTLPDEQKKVGIQFQLQQELNNHLISQIIHRYSLQQSIHDRTTLPIIILDQFVPAQIHTPQTDFALNNLSNFSQTIKEKIIIETNTNLNIESKAQQIWQHFKTHVYPNHFKALIVTNSRDACIQYYKALKKLIDHEEQIAICISELAGDNEEKKQYCHSTEIEQSILNRFLTIDQNPQIIIVNDKLITGFDAPLLQCLYLDRVLTGEQLWQAVARVNRPWYDTDNYQAKDYGIIMPLTKTVWSELDQITRSEPTAFWHINNLYQITSKITGQINALLEAKGILPIFDATQQLSFDFKNKFLNLFENHQFRQQFLEQMVTLIRNEGTFQFLKSKHESLKAYQNSFKFYLLLFYAVWDYFLSIDKIDWQKLVNSNTQQLLTTEIIPWYENSILNKKYISTTSASNINNSSINNQLQSLQEFFQAVSTLKNGFYLPCEENWKTLWAEYKTTSEIIKNDWQLKLDELKKQVIVHQQIYKECQELILTFCQTQKITNNNLSKNWLNSPLDLYTTLQTYLYPNYSIEQIRDVFHALWQQCLEFNESKFSFLTKIRCWEWIQQALNTDLNTKNLLGKSKLIKIHVQLCQQLQILMALKQLSINA